MFAHREVHDGVGVAITDRRGGVSRGAWTSLNLAGHVGDDPDAVAANRARVRTELVPDGALVAMDQVHGAAVAVVDGPPAVPPAADALVTATAGLALTVLVADCAPVLLWDRHARVVAAAHVGRRGLAAGVVGAAVDAMVRLQARPERTRALVGPAVCPDHYEVPAAMRDEVEVRAPGSATTTTAGAPALDIRAGLVRQLQESGLRAWTVLPQCTAETQDCYSYRRDGATGRFAGVVWLLA